MNSFTAETPRSNISVTARSHRYIPFMKTKAGEIVALRNLSRAAQTRILPLFHICEQVKPSFLPNLTGAWAGKLTAVDGSFNFGKTRSSTTMTELVLAMRNAGVPTMPCWDLSDPLQHQHAARGLVDDLGALVKVSLANIPSATSCLNAAGLSSASADLVIDLKHISSVDVPSFAGYVTNTLAQNTCTLRNFRSLTLAAAAPKDHATLTLGVNRIVRKDWLLWNAVRTDVPFQLDYGDYLTGHPDLTEPPGVAMANATVSARYTLDSTWLIIKGRKTGGQNGIPMGEQFRAHAGLIANDPGFAGVPDAWADFQINQAAIGMAGLGSRSKWSGFAANRHLSLVADRLP